MTQILQPFMMLTLLISLGGYLYFIKLIDLDFCRRLSRLVVRVTFPAMLFVSMYKNIDLAALKAAWMFPLVGLGTSLFLAITAHLSGRWLGLEGMTFSTFQILCTNGNNIFLPVPIISAIFGAPYLIYAFLFELGAGLFYWSYGISYFRPGPRFSLKRLLNLNMAALLTGLGLGLWGFSLPSAILGGLEILGNITIGSAMLIIGALVANSIEGKKLWRREVWLVVVHRFVLSPLVGVVLFAFWNLPSDLSTILLFMLTMPPLVTTALVAANFNGDETLATLGVVIPTLLSFVLVPLLLIWRA